MKVILFGAGASIPFFKKVLTTQYITNEVCAISRWERIIDMYWREKQKHTLSARKIVKLIKKIRLNIPNCNFEDIAESLDKMTTFCNELPAVPVSFNRTLKAFRLCGLIKKKRQISIDSIIPFLFRCVIADIFYEIEQFQKDSYETLISKQKEFIHYIKTEQMSTLKKRDNISIITLNYDDCIYSSVKDSFCTGYINNKEKDNRQFFSSQIFLRAQDTLSFLHGTMRFYNNLFTNKQIEHPSSRIKGIGNLDDDHSTININDMSYNTFITTGKDKESSFNRMPYSLYYHKMATDILINCNELLIIGYSFGDEHINRLLKNYWASESIKRMIVIDKYDKDVTDNDSESNIIDKLQDICRGTPINWDDEIELNKINKEGYGYLFPKILFYKKGYENFLEEYESVICYYSNCLFEP